jgi:hypothetical protein
LVGSRLLLVVLPGTVIFIVVYNTVGNMVSF